MTILYFDCFSGISGDMALGALIDAGLELGRLRAELYKLGLEGWQLDAERRVRGWLAGTQALVVAPEQPGHRHLSDVHAILEQASDLDPAIKARSLAVFSRLARAEGAVHGIAPEQVHFHEVGALDAIVDVVGVVAGLHLLGVSQVYASALPLGSGWAHAAHGAIPVPGPATLALLAEVQAPILPDTTPVELVTPTGAALLAELARFERPAMRISRVGYGFGRRELERPNALRCWLGQSLHELPAASLTNQSELSGRRQQALLSASANDQSTPASHNPGDVLVLLETNIDDQPGEQLAYVVEQLLAAGARDAWLSPIQMKKGRPASLLAALVPAETEEAACDLILRETTTLGIRRRPVERHTAEREIVTVTTALGPVRIKRKRWRGADLGAAPEYEDCAALARQHGLALREVYQLALQAHAAFAPTTPVPQSVSDVTRSQATTD